ncbi:MAG: lactonase family protein [Planctomycetota bacterium]|nr:lactonase family protein [Planctomycetota bacterium]
MPKPDQGDGALVFVANARSGEISRFALNYRKLTLRPLGVTHLEGIAEIVLASPSGRFLYSEFQRDGEFYQATLLINPIQGDLELLSDIPLPAGMVYQALDHSGRFLLSASYNDDLVTVHPLGREGLVQGEMVASLPAGRHPHAVTTDPSNRFAYVTYLGTDLTAQFSFDALTGKAVALTPPAVNAPAGSGPRHLCFSPDGRYAFLLTEMAGTIVSYRLDQDSGRLEEVGTEAFVPPEIGLDPGQADYYSTANIRYRAEHPASPPIPPKTWGADLQVRSDGRFIYASERSQSLLTLLAIDPVSGRLARQKTYTTLKQPRGILLEPRGRFLLVAGEEASAIALYAIDPASGELKLVEQQAVGDGPVWQAVVPLY